MSVIQEFTVSTGDFELGRAISEASVESHIEVLLSEDDQFVSIFWTPEAGDVGATIDHAAVREVVSLDIGEGHVLYAVKWKRPHDSLLETLVEADAEVIRGEGTDGEWTLAARFESRQDATAFREACSEGGIDADFERVYEPTDTSGDPPFGLTQRQYEALSLAIEEGYYDIPREIKTSELGDRLGISDQAVTERLRRAIVSLVENTVLSQEFESTAQSSH